MNYLRQYGVWLLLAAVLCVFVSREVHRYNAAQNEKIKNAESQRDAALAKVAEIEQARISQHDADQNAIDAYRRQAALATTPQQQVSEINQQAGTQGTVTPEGGVVFHKDDVPKLYQDSVALGTCQLTLAQCQHDRDAYAQQVPQLQAADSASQAMYKAQKSKWHNGWEFSALVGYDARQAKRVYGAQAGYELGHIRIGGGGIGSTAFVRLGVQF